MAIKATKIRLKSDASGDDEREIVKIYLVGGGLSDDGWRMVSTVVTLLNDGNDIVVDKHPSTYLEVVNAKTKYVRSQANGTTNDNLLKLPQA